MIPHKKKPSKNIFICLDGTDNQYGEDKSNILNLFRMLKREPGKQVAYYDPGVGTLGDPSFRTGIAKKINKGLGQAFGRGLMKNLIEAYSFLMDNYEDGDKVFIFGFSRGAYTARALAGFIRDCGLFEKSAKNLLPYAISEYLKKEPTEAEAKTKFHKNISGFRSTYARRLNRDGDPRDPDSNEVAHYQLRIHFMGLFDTVKSYGWIYSPVVLRNEEENKSVLHIRHAISIDEKRAFFRQMHWKASKKFQTCKEVWFAGVHSDVGGGYEDSKSGLAKVALEWMVHEAITFGMQVNLEKYCLILQKELDEQNNWKQRTPTKEKNSGKYSGPNPIAEANESLTSAWHLVQLLPKKLEYWELTKNKGMGKSIRTIKSQQDRTLTEENHNPLLIHESVIERMEKTKYKPKNLIPNVAADIDELRKFMEKTISTEKVFTAIEQEKLRKKTPEEKKEFRFKEKIKKINSEISLREQEIGSLQQQLNMPPLFEQEKDSKLDQLKDQYIQEELKELGLELNKLKDSLLKKLKGYDKSKL